MRVTIAKEYTDQYQCLFAPGDAPMTKDVARAIAEPVIEQAVASHRRPSARRYIGEFSRGAVATIVPLAGPAALAIYRVGQCMAVHRSPATSAARALV